MNAKEAIENIKKLIFNQDPTPVPLPTVFGSEYKLADGTMVMIDKLEVGGVVKIGEDVAPDGEHYLEDGTKIEIKDGMIAMVEPKMEDPIDPTEMQNQMTQLKAEFEALKENFETHKAAFNKVSVKADTQEKANQELVKLVEFLAEQPIEAPAQKPIDFDKLSPLEKFRIQKAQAN